MSSNRRSSRGVALVVTAAAAVATAGLVGGTASAATSFPYYYSGQGRSVDYSAAYNYATTNAAINLSRYIHSQAKQVSCGSQTLLRAVPIKQGTVWKFDVYYRAQCVRF